jgi:hypothetical protein
MDFLKKHYEKVVLGVVLVGLAVAAGFLPFIVASQKAGIDVATRPPGKVDPISNLDLTLPEQSYQRAVAPAVIDFGPPNHLFNPMPWIKTPGGHLILGEKVGPNRLVATNITPLYLKLSLESVNVLPTSTNYLIGIENQAAAQVPQRRKRTTLCTMIPLTKNETFVMVEVKGKPEEPTAIVVHLNDWGTNVVILKDTPFMGVAGFMADLSYDLEKKVWNRQRENGPTPLVFNGEGYNIVAIRQDEVVLSAISNQKRYIIKALSAATNTNATP